MMLMLRRGRPVQIAGSIVDVDLTLELTPERARARGPHEPWRPPVEVFEVAAELVVRVELAGLTAGAVEVLIDGDVLVVRGERHVAPCDDHRRFHESRIRYGPFLATVDLPFPIVERAASADYDDGLLTIRLPRQGAVRIGTVDPDGGPAAR
jgi:HSP20 family molecular chaperone IbpA